MSKKKLSINSEPKIHTFTHHAFLNAIVSSDERVDKIAAKVQVKNFVSYDWRQQLGELTCHSSENALTFEANEWNTNMNHCFYRECQNRDEIELTIEKQLFSHAWGAISVFVTKDSQQDMMQEKEYTFRLSNYCKDGVSLVLENQSISVCKRVWSAPFSFVLKKDKLHYMAMIKKDGEEYVLHEWDAKDPTEKQRIGFAIKLYDNVYYEWFYSNFIQVYRDRLYPGLPLDYVCNDLKSWNSYTTNHLVDYMIQRSDQIPIYGLSVLEFVKRSIDMGQYIEMWVNENYIEGIKDKEPNIHQNLIYGYDDEKRQLFVLHLQMGIPKEMTMTYDEFESEDNFSDEWRLVIPTTYNPDYDTYTLNPAYLASVLRQYLYAEDVSFIMQNNRIQKDKMYGMEVLEFFLTQEGLDLIGTDLRIIHLFFERATCMKERLEYLVARKIMTQEEKDRVLPYVKKEEYLASVIQNIIIKGYIVGNATQKPDYYLKIKERLEKLIECQKEYLPVLIGILEMK